MAEQIIGTAALTEILTDLKAEMESQGSIVPSQATVEESINAANELT